MKPRIKVLWLQGVTCNGNTHSFLNFAHLSYILDTFEFLYHSLLPSTYTLEEISTCTHECDVLIFEGAYDPVMERVGTRLEKLVHYYASHAQYVIAAGSCASFGGMFKHCDPERITGLGFDEKESKGPLAHSPKLINLSGCPMHPEWMGYTLRMIADNKPMALDELHRPKELYSYLAHHGCTRNEYFEWKVDSDHFGTKEGCLFYKQGCRGPMTHASCNKILWNDVSSKTRVGTPCFGCTEPDFPRINMFETKTNMSIPQDVPIGISKRSYLTMAGIAKSFHIPRLEQRLIDDNT
jgi:hydrogenase small subunit